MYRRKQNRYNLMRYDFAEQVPWEQKNNSPTNISFERIAYNICDDINCVVDSYLECKKNYHCNLCKWSDFIMDNYWSISFISLSFIMALSSHR